MEKSRFFQKKMNLAFIRRNVVPRKRNAGLTHPSVARRGLSVCATIPKIVTILLKFGD
jgi:hypothetical protein